MSRQFNGNGSEFQQTESPLSPNDAYPIDNASYWGMEPYSSGAGHAQFNQNGPLRDRYGSPVYGEPFQYNADPWQVAWTGQEPLSGFGPSTNRMEAMRPRAPLAGGTGYRHFGRRTYGKAPKNFQRSSDRIREEIAENLMSEPQIDASDVEIQVRDCEVLLEGTVPERWMKRQIEDIAECVMGVEEVENRVRVKRQKNSSTQSGSNDEDLDDSNKSSRGSAQHPSSSSAKPSANSSSATTRKN